MCVTARLSLCMTLPTCAYAAENTEEEVVYIEDNSTDISFAEDCADDAGRMAFQDSEKESADMIRNDQEKHPESNVAVPEEYQQEDPDKLTDENLETEPDEPNILPKNCE